MMATPTVRNSQARRRCGGIGRRRSTRGDARRTGAPDVLRPRSGAPEAVRPGAGALSWARSVPVARLGAGRDRGAGGGAPRRRVPPGGGFRCGDSRRGGSPNGDRGGSGASRDQASRGRCGAPGRGADPRTVVWRGGTVEPGPGSGIGGTDPLGPDRLDPDQFGPDRADPDRADPDRADPDRFGPGQLGGPGGGIHESTGRVDEVDEVRRSRLGDMSIRVSLRLPMTAQRSVTSSSTGQLWTLTRRRRSPTTPAVARTSPIPPATTMPEEPDSSSAAPNPPVPAGTPVGTAVPPE